MLFFISSGLFFYFCTSTLNPRFINGKEICHGLFKTFSFVLLFGLQFLNDLITFVCMVFGVKSSLYLYLYCFQRSWRTPGRSSRTRPLSGSTCRTSCRPRRRRRSSTAGSLSSSSTRRGHSRLWRYVDGLF